MPAGMDSLVFSLQMRDIVNSMVREQIDQMRPKYRYATVKGIDRSTGKCTVVYNGEQNQVIVNMGSIQPKDVNQVVRIEGIGTDKFIGDVIGEAYEKQYLKWGTTDPLYSAGGVRVKWDGDVDYSGPYDLTVNNYFPKPGEKVIGIIVPGLDTVIASAGDLTSRTASILTAEPVNWIPLQLQNGWQPYSTMGMVDGNRYNLPRVTKTRSGIVKVEGLIKNGNATAGTLVATLPEGYRPSWDQQMFVSGHALNGWSVGSFDVLANGGIYVRATNNVWASLDHISFPSADVAPADAWTPAVYAANWSDYSQPDWAPAGFWVDANGIVWERGLVKYGPGGNPAVNTPITSGYPAPGAGKILHRASTAMNSFAGIYKKPTGNDDWIVGAGTSYVSLDGIPYPQSGAPIAWYPADVMYNGWVSYDGGATYPLPGYYKTNDGLVICQGLMKNGGTNYGDGNVFYFAKGCRPRDKMLWTTISNNVGCRTDLGNDGLLKVGSSVSSSWWSIDSLNFIAEQ